MKKSRFTVEFVTDSSTALKLAQARGVLPLALDTEGLREAYSKDVLARSVFSARTTHAGYLASVERQVEAVLSGRDVGTARRVLKGLLTRAGYTPEKGFPGDKRRGIPAARPGSITDLSSNARLDLILETQASLLQGAAMQLKGNEPEALRLYPAYELVRDEQRRAPRDWVQRWKDAGGKVRKDKNGRARLVALKNDVIWALIGDFNLFTDALGVDHPPFAFRSGMGWRELDRKECVALKLLNPADAPQRGRKLKPLPPAVVTVKPLSERLRAALRRGLAAIESKGDTISQRATPTTQAAKPKPAPLPSPRKPAPVARRTPPPPPPSRAQRLAQAASDARAEFNALLSIYATR